MVERHGPLVLSVCRRVLADAPDADDAFQATFLVLARKAGSVRRPEQLGNWLYGVALRCARRVRSTTRRGKEQPMLDLPAPATSDSDWADVRPVLDEEIGKLPDKLRAALVMCELQGVERVAAAARLNIPEGTLSSRLARAKDALRRRLVKRGIVLSASGVGFVLSQAAVVAAVPPALTAAAVLASVGYAAGAAGGLVTTAAIATKEIQAMFLKKLIVGTVASTMAVGVVGIGVVGSIVSDSPAIVQAAMDPKAKDDKDALKGDWKITSAKQGGRDADDQIVGQPVTIDGAKIKFRHEATYTIDATQKPKMIDVEIKEGPVQEQGTWKGVYQVDGDKLTLHIGPPGVDRPTDFESKEGTMALLIVLERVKK
jgi:RNA polymerase sigma factor (sigma-70 family)